MEERERERGLERESARAPEESEACGERKKGNRAERVRVQKVMFSWGLGKALERVALEWSRSRLMSRWRSRKVRCKLRLWKGKEGSPHGLGWDRKALGSLSMV